MSKLMPNTITLEPYWLGVFAAAGRPDLYEVTQADIQRALEAGLAPYLRGEPISAPQFADAAIAELKKNMGGHVDAAPIPIEPIQDVIVH